MCILTILYGSDCGSNNFNVCESVFGSNNFIVVKEIIIQNDNIKKICTSIYFDFENRVITINFLCT